MFWNFYEETRKISLDNKNSCNNCFSCKILLDSSKTSPFLSGFFLVTDDHMKVHWNLTRVIPSSLHIYYPSQLFHRVYFNRI